MDPEVGCVVVSIDFYTSYIKMTKAVTYLHNSNVIFLVPNMDEKFPYSPTLTLPGKSYRLPQ